MGRLDIMGPPLPLRCARLVRCDIRKNPNTASRRFIPFSDVFLGQNGCLALSANLGGHATRSASVSPFLVIRGDRSSPHLLEDAASPGALKMGPFSFFALLIATFTLSSAALLLGSMVTERKPKGSTAALHTSAVQMVHSPGAGETSGTHRR